MFLTKSLDRVDQEVCIDGELDLDGLACQAQQLRNGLDLKALKKKERQVDFE